VRAEAISNFVDPHAVLFRRRTSLRPVFLSNRNFQALYNVPCVLRAFAVIQARIPEARLIVIGDGPERAHVHETARALALRNVEFVGAVPPTEMGRWYDRADVYVNASDIDNMPNSIIEAFACALPVVTTRAGGIPYVVEHERNGLLVDLGDHEGLAAAALRLLDDPDLAERLIVEGLRDVDQLYTWAAVSHRWAALYRRLVQARDAVPAESGGQDAAPDAAGLLPEASAR
jgi:L-malate glycosyltransferase